MDGLSGSGKRLLGSLLSGIPKVDQFVLSQYIDQTASLFEEGKIDFETAVYLLRTNHNLVYYDNVILRHANFRKSKTSIISIRGINISNKEQHLMMLKYIKNLKTKLLCNIVRTLLLILAHHILQLLEKINIY